MNLIFKTKPLLILILGLIFTGLNSCSDEVYPFGSAQKKAYKQKLKEKSAAYRQFNPVKLPKDTILKEQWTTPSANFNIRTPALVVIHHTAGKSCEQSLKIFTDPHRKREVSTHYLVCKDGNIYNIVNEQYRAWHAGAGRWAGMHNINSVSLGIDMDNNGNEEYTEEQIHSLIILLKSIKNRYKIPTGNFVGHADVSPKRKIDPNVEFPWKQLADEAFGYWADSPLKTPPKDFNAINALRLIGYDIRDSSAAIKAFKRHYIQTNLNPTLSEKERQVLYDIFLKYKYEKG